MPTLLRIPFPPSSTALLIISPLIPIPFSLLLLLFLSLLSSWILHLLLRLPASIHLDAASLETFYEPTPSPRCVAPHISLRQSPLIILCCRPALHIYDQANSTHLSPVRVVSRTIIILGADLAALYLRTTTSLFIVLTSHPCFSPDSFPKYIPCLRITSLASFYLEDRCFCLNHAGEDFY